MDETVAAELSAIRESIANLASRVDELVSAYLELKGFINKHKAF